MQNKVALEEHYEMFVNDAVRSQLAESEGFEAHYLDGVVRGLQDVDARVEKIDHNGTGMWSWAATTGGNVPRIGR